VGLPTTTWNFIPDELQTRPIVRPAVEKFQEQHLSGK
jgi:hypothetical protein